MSIVRIFLLFSAVITGNVLCMDIGQSAGNYEQWLGLIRPQSHLTELDLRSQERINSGVIERMGILYPNVQGLIINASSTEREGFVGLTPNLAEAIIRSFPHLRSIRILGANFRDNPNMSGLMRLAALKPDLTIKYQ